MLFYCANVPCSYFHLHCDLSRAATGPTCSACVAHTKGMPVTFIGTARQSVEPQFVLALKIQIKYAKQWGREGVRKGRGEMWENWFGFCLKTSHQFAAAAKQFTLDIVNFRRSSAKNERENNWKPNHKKARDGQKGKRVREGGQWLRGWGEKWNELAGEKNMSI